MRVKNGVYDVKCLVKGETCSLPYLILWAVYDYWEKKRVRNKGKCKSVPLQAWSDPEGSRKLSFPDFMTMAQERGKVVSHTHRPHLLPRKFSWYSFLLEAE